MKSFKNLREEMSHDKDWGKPGSVKHAKKITPGQANEGTWAIPKTPKDKAALKKLMSQPIKLGKEGEDASGKIYSLIGDDELFDDLYVAGKKNPNGDARPIIKKHMKRLRISEAKDPNEYDKEGEMMKNQLRQICSANEKLMKMVGDDDNLPEWVQNKVTKATDYIRSVRDYLEAENEKISDMNEGVIGDFLAKRKKEGDIKKSLQKQHDFHTDRIKHYNNESDKPKTAKSKTLQSHNKDKADAHGVARDHIANALAAHNKGDHKARNTHVANWKSHTKKSEIGRDHYDVNYKMRG